MAKVKLPKVVSPRATAAYAWLNKKDTKFDKEGHYKITLVFDKKDIGEGRLEYGKKVVSGKEWVKTLMALAKNHGGSDKLGQAGCPFKDGDKKLTAEGKPNEDFAGTILLPLKTSYKPKLVDTKHNPLPGNLTVFSGDVVKAEIEPRPWESALGKGLSFYVSKVMLIEKSSRDESTFGEEEGFVVAEGDLADADSDFGEDDDNDNNGDF